MRQPRYKAVVDAYAAAIRDGRLAPGTRLPTHRELASRHGIALATATRVYAELAAAGLVVGEPGRGTFVRDQSGFGGLEPRRLPRTARRVDLSFSQPLSAEQPDELRAALRRLAGAGNLEALLTQHPPGGRESDRAVVATALLDRGIDVPPDNVLLTSGAQHGVDVAVRTLAGPGGVVAADALTYPGLKLAATTGGVEVCPVSCCADGTDLDALEALCRTRRIAAIYAMPTVHNPLGFVLDAAARHRLVDIARRHDCALIEDATYAFLVPEAGPTLYSLAPERTWYIGSLSKNLATGLRFGYLVVPTGQRAAAVRTLRAAGWSVAGIVTALAVGWLADGTVARLEKQRRDDAAQRQRIARKALCGFAYTAHPRSWFGWLELPDGLRNDAAARLLAERGVLVSTADAFAVAPHPPNALRLSLATPPPADLPGVLETVRDVLVLAGP